MDVIRHPRRKSLVINVRGTNGSGKTQLMYDFLHEFGSTPLKNKKGKVWAYRVHFEPTFYILGRYEKLDDGCDTISGMHEIADRIRKLAAMGDVLFEGIRVSMLSQAWVDLAKSMPQAHFIFATLDTPWKRIVKQIRKRRKEEGFEGKYDVSNVAIRRKAVLAAHERLEKAGMDTRWLYYKRPTHNIINWLLENEHGGEK